MLPIFEAQIDSFDSGIYKISLVDYPAVESNFVYFGSDKAAKTSDANFGSDKAVKTSDANFNKDNQPMKYSVIDEEQHMITGVIMRADFYIYRNDPKFGEYYVFYSKDTIKQMAERMMEQGTFNNINLMHKEDSDIEGVKLVEIYIKNTQSGIDPTGFESIEDGSLFATYKVENRQIWQQIKDGTFKGFSLEGLFDLEYTKKQKYSMTQNMKKLFNKIMKSFVQCGSIQTDKGELYWVGEADLQIGDELFYDSGDEIIKVDDGDYTLTDGTVVTVTDGLVSSIVKKDGEPEGELDMEDETQPEEVTVEDVETVVEEIVDTQTDDLKAKVDELEAKLAELEAKVDALLEKPAVEPIVEEYAKQTQGSSSFVPTFGSKSKMFK